MHTVDMLEEAVGVAMHLGYTVRQEWLGGSGGGACELKGEKLLFVDLALGPGDQLDQVLDALRRDPRSPGLPMHHELHELLKLRKTA